MDPAEEKKYGRLFQQITMRGAVAAALGLNIAHRQAGKLVMTNIEQMVNVLHALLLTEEDKCVRTTTYAAPAYRSGGARIAAIRPVRSRIRCERQSAFEHERQVQRTDRRHGRRTRIDRVKSRRQRRRIRE